MHSSIKLEQPIEFINVTPVNPLISKCQIKVCYVSDKPNRNGSVITKEAAKEIANSLPGCPIVGYYNEANEDFEEHNRMIDLSNGKFEIKDTTRPYGFVDLNAKVWFAKYLDDAAVEREYMVTEGWLWTGQYPECRRIIEKGNNQSMELDTETLDATWSRDDNGDPKFFIINEAIISKLCILGEDVEPCFEGANITAPVIQFSFDDGFKEQLFAMMKELKDLLNEGGAKVFTRYAVTIGDTLWNALYNHIAAAYPSNNEGVSSIYRIDGIYEESEQKFAVLQNRSDMKYYRLNFSINEAEEFSASETLVEVTSTYTVDENDPQFPEAEVKAFEDEKFSNNEGKDDEEIINNSDNDLEGEEKAEIEEEAANNDDDANDEDEAKETNFANKDEEKDEDSDEEKEDEKCPKCGKPVDECDCEEEKEEDKKEYSLDAIPEYVELQTKYSELENKFNALQGEYEALEAKVAPLSEFKAQAERKDKEAMIASFYMLSDEDKEDVVTNIDTYSLDDIEAKLSIICVRNKVNFNLDEDKDPNKQGSTVFNLDCGNDESTPAWVKRAMSVAKTLK